MPEIADEEPLPLGELPCCHHARLAWVAADDADIPVAHLIAEGVGEFAEQVDVVGHRRERSGQQTRHGIQQFRVPSSASPSAT